MFIHPAELSHSSPHRARQLISELPKPKPTPKPNPTSFSSIHPRLHLRNTAILCTPDIVRRPHIACILNVVSKHQQSTNRGFTYHRRSWRRIVSCLRLNASASTSCLSVNVSRTQDASDHPLMHTAGQTMLSSFTRAQPFSSSSSPTTFIDSPALANRVRA